MADSIPLHTPAPRHTPPPLYVPVLPARSSALAAYAGLKPWIRAVTAPVWTVPPRTGPERLLGHRPEVLYDRDPVALAAHVRRRTVDIMRAQGALPAWVDAFHVEDEAGPVAGELWNHLPGSPLRPVTGVERPEWQQDATARTARASGNGLGVRVLLPGLPDERQAEAVRELARRVREAGAGPLDLLLDLGAVTDEHHRADKWAVRALELLGGLHRWRTVALIAGSLPPDLSDVPVGEVTEPHRFDWDVRHLVLHVAGPDALRPVYGDYGAQHVGGADQPTERGGGPAWGLLRYTTERTFLLAKAPTGGPDRAERVRSLALRLVETMDFRGPHFSDGDRWLDACARQSGSAGTGTPGRWIEAGHSQHMTYVTRQLSVSDPSGALN
ncbi:hypothetical protein QIS99_23330 [Streptomyces sp. B-S-A8]|uniref:Beta protein n=1 Tax=Streptomyces solicavernae TaxID=3043614 RepID=A0ABT6RXD7_9ACTN|nr:hypothetical protein [Streptomyces sp. B-S-A8]MDI3389105.1 hypothetical protein [Streptomyces sp. B-S-A8]